MTVLSLLNFEQENYGGGTVSEEDGVITLSPSNSSHSSANIIIGDNHDSIHSLSFEFKLESSDDDICYFDVSIGSDPLVNGQNKDGYYWHQSLSDCSAARLQGSKVKDGEFFLEKTIDGLVSEDYKKSFPHYFLKDKGWHTLSISCFKDGFTLLIVDQVIYSIIEFLPPLLSHAMIHQGFHTSRQRTILQVRNIEVNTFDYESIIPKNILTNVTSKPTWSNKQSKDKANTQPEKLQTLAHNQSAKLIGKTNNYTSLINQQGEQRPIGYYESTVLINGLPSTNKRVYCYTNNGQLLDETFSDSEGNYRFDYLDLNKKYMFVAQYSNEVNTPPDYNAVAADWQTPTPYKE